jgi:predicted permease
MREDLCAEVRAVSSGYFSVMGVPVEAGRGVDATDAAETEPVVVINRRTAEILWPGQDPLGHRLATGLGGDDLRGFRLYRVVGVVPDVKQFNLHEPAPPQTYLPLPQWPRTARSVVLDVSDEPARVVPSVREAVWRVDSELPITEVRRIDELVSATMAQPRLRTVLVAIFAGLALVLALVGLYGVVSYSVGSRRRELALRLAMGARRGRLLRLVLQRGLRPVFPGMALGLLGALALSTTLESFLFEVSTKDPLPYVVVPALMLVVAIVASLVPARTGVRIDPATTLREE